MTTEGLTYIVDGETNGLPGSEASPFRPAGVSSKPVIQIHRATTPPQIGSDGAITSGVGFESLGVIAVRLLAEWKLPRARMERGPAVLGEEDADPLPAASREEERLRDR